MSTDVCFWKYGDGPGDELYERAADGDGTLFVPSPSVQSFRERILATWPELADCLEPLEYDPYSGEAEDTSRYLLITIPNRIADKYTELVAMGISFGLVGYDPQTMENIGSSGSNLN